MPTVKAKAKAKSSARISNIIKIAIGKHRKERRRRRQQSRSSKPSLQDMKDIAIIQSLTKPTQPASSSGTDQNISALQATVANIIQSQNNLRPTPTPAPIAPLTQVRPPQAPPMGVAPPYDAHGGRSPPPVLADLFQKVPPVAPRAPRHRRQLALNIDELSPLNLSPLVRENTPEFQPDSIFFPPPRPVTTSQETQTVPIQNALTPTTVRRNYLEAFSPTEHTTEGFERMRSYVLQNYGRWPKKGRSDNVPRYTRPEVENWGLGNIQALTTLYNDVRRAPLGEGGGGGGGKIKK
jgi:hypothetical protein